MGVDEVSGSDTSSVLEFELEATPQDLMRGCDTLRVACREAGVPENTTHSLVLAFEELGSNVVRHGYRSGHRGRLYVNLRIELDRLRLELVDDAEPFNPLEVQPREPGSEAAGPGGMGLQIVRALAEKLEYARASEQNRFALTMHREPRLSEGGS